MLQIQLLSSMTLAAIVLLLLPFVPTVVVGIERQRRVTSAGLPMLTHFGVRFQFRARSGGHP